MNEETLFAAALEKPTPAERQAFLAQACGGDAALRQRVDRLLAADQQSSGILERGRDALPPSTTPSGPPLAADRSFAGHFTLRQKLGEGGMGEVWVADQTEPVRRRVALKVIRPGLDSARMLARFNQERQALALMDHPHINKVLDAGIDEAGRPYFAMELIEGVPITTYCDEARLSPRQRLELFVPVCQAVQHAHQKGIIHRDLKPSNILVARYDGRAVPKVIDFGVAKATGPRLTEQSIDTEVGTLVGTVEYMSPEQAELNNLDVDTRSDIYTLGVILYELLAGSVPFTREELHAAAFPDMLRMIKEVDPPRPSTRLSGSGALASVAAVRQTEPKKLIALVRGELDWIVIKCLEKDRNRRYQAANGLARDLELYLANEPVEACPPSAGYRLRKFASKYRTPLLVAGAFLLLLVGAVIASTWQAVRATVAEKAALQQRRLAEEKEKEAKAYGLVQLVLNVDTPKVLPLIAKMAAYRRWTDPMLRDVPEKSPQRLHASLALLPVDPGQVDYLYGRLFEAEARGVLPVIRHALLPYKDRLVDKLLVEAQWAKEPENTALARELADLLLIDTTRWTVLRPSEMTSQGGATLTLLDDGSILAGGNNPDRAVYSLVARTDLKQVNAIRLEALPDPSLPSSGPGRSAPTGNFHLSKWRVFSGGAAVPLTKIVVAYSETPDFQNVIDGGTDSSMGWSNGFRAGKANRAVVATRLLRAADDTLKIDLYFSPGPWRQHGLGRFRLSVSADPATFYREEIRLALQNKDFGKLRSLASDKRVPRILAGKQSASAAELLQLASLCQEYKKRYVVAVQLYEKAFQTDSRLLEDWSGQHRYKAACAAARAGTAPADQLLTSHAQQARFRAQARRWLQRDLERLARHLKVGEPRLVVECERRLADWLANPDLAGIRDPAALAQLPNAERKLCEKLWAEVAGLIQMDTTRWTVLRPAEMKSQGGATLMLLDDGSVLAGGKNPDQDVYSLVARTDLQQVNAIRLEALPDRSLPWGGPGRSASGIFHLGELRVFSGGQPVSLTNIIVVYDEAQEFRNVIAGRAHGTRGWSNAPRDGQPNTALVATRLRRAPHDDLKIELHFSPLSQWPQHGLGRFRLSVSDDPVAVEREQKRLAALAPYLALDDPKRAANFLTKVTTANPKVAAHWLALALAHARLKETERARKACGQAVALLKPAGADAALRPLLREVLIALGPYSAEATALRAAAAGNPPAVLTEAIRQNPDKAAGYRNRANWFVERGLWKQASADLAGAFRLVPDTHTGMRLGIFLVHTSEIDRYRAHCRAMLKRWASTEKNADADQTLKTILLLPDFKADAKQLARLAGVAVSGDKKAAWFEWWMFTKGLYDYRTGKYQGALAACRESRRRAPASKGDLQALASMDLAIEAMALHRLGDEAGAKRALAEAKSNVGVYVPGIDGHGPHDWLIAHLLYREAVGLIAGKKT